MSKRTLDGFVKITREPKHPPAADSSPAKMPKRTLDGFVKVTREPKPPPATDSQSTLARAPALTSDHPQSPTLLSTHPTYPFALPHLPPSTVSALSDAATTSSKPINDRPDLDLLYFAPFVPASTEKQLFKFLRESLFFYRVKYTIARFGTKTEVNTPRYTTVFGVDATASFSGGEGGDESGDKRVLVDAKTGKPVAPAKYKCQPRPIPECLEFLRRVTEAATGAEFNFCLVNYYATGVDSISYHSDDESFLGPRPAIASLSLGAKRDFLMKHKPAPGAGPGVKEEGGAAEAAPLKLQLASGDMVLMRGTTQAKWLHSLPKRKGVEADRGRINITFRRAVVPAGTENYYRYNVGGGTVFRWNAERKVMLPWVKDETQAS